MFIEFTEAGEDKSPILVQSDHVTAVIRDKEHREILMENGRSFWVKESFEEIQKRLGLSISPRAETLMKVG